MTITTGQGQFPVPDFNRVSRSFNVSGGAQRHESKITVKKTGAMRGNTGAKELMVEFAKDHGLDPNDFQVGLGGNEAIGQVALYAPKPGDTDLMKVTLYDNSVSVHAGQVFLEHPKLRPAGTVDCHLERTKDAKGVDCIAVHVGGGSPTRRVKRQKKNESSEQATQGKA